MLQFWDRSDGQPKGRRMQFNPVHCITGEGLQHGLVLTNETGDAVEQGYCWMLASLVDTSKSDETKEPTETPSSIPTSGGPSRWWPLLPLLLLLIFAG
jgi:hypothetical protein